MSFHSVSKKFKVPPSARPTTKQIKHSDPSSHPRELTNATNNFMHKEPENRVISKRKLSFEYKSSLTNGLAVMHHRKRNYRQSYKMTMEPDQEGETSYSEILEILKRMKYINKFSFNSSKILPKPAALALNKLYNKIRGLSLPVLTTGQLNELTCKTKLLRKIRALSHLRLEVIPGISENDGLHESHILVFYQHLKYVKYLKTFVFKDYSMMTSKSLVGMVNSIILTNKKTLEFLSLNLPWVMKTQRGSDATLQTFKVLRHLNKLESAYFELHGDDFSQHCVKQTHISLKSLKNLKKCQMKITHPHIIKAMECFNDCPQFELDLDIKLKSFNTESILYVKNFEFPVRVTLDEISSRRLLSDNFMSKFFSSIGQVKKLERFSYHEGSEDQTKMARDNFLKYFALPFQTCTTLKKLDLDLSMSYKCAEVIAILREGIKKMPLEHLELSIFDYIPEDDPEGSIIHLIKYLKDVSTLRVLYVSLDGASINSAFMKSLIDSLTQCVQINHFGSLSMKANFEILVYLFRRLSKMINLESSLFWFRDIGEDDRSQPSEERVLKAIYSSVVCLAKLNSLNLVMPFDMDELEIANLKYKLREKNRKLELSIEANFD